MKIYLFSDFFGNRIGGMEVHQEAFLRHYPETTLIVRSKGFKIYTNGRLKRCCSDIYTLADYIRAAHEERRIFFFNNLSWITDIKALRKAFPNEVFIMRSGGNDVYKALDKTLMPTLKEKLEITTDVINCYLDRLIVNSDYSYFRNIDIGISPRKMIKIRGGVDGTSAMKNIGIKSEIRRKIDEKFGTAGKKLLVIAARLVPFKGIPEFIKCFAESSVSNKCHLILIGDGIQKELIVELLTNKLDLKNYTYLGCKSNEETKKILSAADLFINPSLEYTEKDSGGTFIHTETMGRGMMEAVMQGVPVLALNSGGTSELFYENSSIGYLADNYDDMKRYLKEFVVSDYSFSAETDYSWNEVFRKYDVLFDSLMVAGKAASLLAFDYDGTIKTNKCSEEELSIIMRRNSNFIYICLTARNAEESLPLMKLLPLRYIIYENGASIASSDGQSVFWNKLASDEKEKKYTEYIISELKAIVKCKQTHPFTIHIRKDDINAGIIEKIYEVICDMPFQVICSDRYVKIQHRIFNKKGALDYLLKDINYSRTVGTGNGLNDVAFILSCDRKFMSKELMESISCRTTDIVPFGENEAGSELLKKMILALKEG